MSREYTKKLLEMITEGILDRDLVITAFCNYMSEDEIYDMMRQEYFLDSDEDSDEDDGQPDEMQEWHDYDPDC